MSERQGHAARHSVHAVYDQGKVSISGIWAYSLNSLKAVVGFRV